MCKANIWFLNAGLFVAVLFLTASTAGSQIGKRFPPEKRIVTDPVTGMQLTFLTSSQSNDYTIRDIHRHWTSDGKWLIFRSQRLPGETLAVNEETGVIVQVTEGAYMPAMCLTAKSMKMYYLRMVLRQPGQTRGGPVQVVEVDLVKLFSDSETGTLKAENEYQRVCGIIPAGMIFGKGMALDADEECVYFILSEEEAAKHLPAGMAVQYDSINGQKEAGPSGIGRININTRETGIVTVVPFAAGNLQSDPVIPGKLFFSSGTEGGASHNTWTVKSDGSGLRPLNPGEENEFVSRAAGKTILQHLSRSTDGRRAAGVDPGGNIYLIDRHSNEMILLSGGHKTKTAGHPYPSFSPDGTRILIQSAMLSDNSRSMDICIIHLPGEERE